MAIGGSHLCTLFCGYSVVIGSRVSCVRYSVVYWQSSHLCTLRNSVAVGSRVTCVRYEILWLLVIELFVYTM